MRKWITFLMTLLVASSASYVSANDTDVFFEAGYRNDNIRWKSRIPASSPDIETVTHFKDLDIFQIGLHARSTLGCNFYVRGSAHWGWIIDGKLDRSTKLHASFGSPFFSDFETITFDTNRDDIVDGRWVFDIDVAIGYPFYFCDCTTKVSPVVGYAFDEQNIAFDRHSFFDFASFDPFESFDGSGGCCREKFINRWYGPFVGVDFEYNPMNCWNLYGTVEYHWALFKGRRHLNSDFGGFNNFNRHRHHHAHGWVVQVGAEYETCHCWTIGLDFEYKDFTAHRRHHCGDDSSFSFFGSDSSSSFDGFKTNVDWRSYAISVTFGRGF